MKTNTFYSIIEWFNMQIFYMKKIPKKIYVLSNLYMANIVQFYSFLIQVEIKKNDTETVV